MASNRALQSAPKSKPVSERTRPSKDRPGLLIATAITLEHVLDDARPVISQPGATSEPVVMPIDLVQLLLKPSLVMAAGFDVAKTSASEPPSLLLTKTGRRHRRD